MRRQIVRYLQILALTLLSQAWCVSYAQPNLASPEPTPEQRDAAFTAQDAAREASAWSLQEMEQEDGDALSQLTANADLVFRGRVESQTFIYDADGTPFTQTDFVLADVVKGRAGLSRFTLLQEGGPSQSGDGRVLLVSNSRHFAVGEDELLFIELQPDAVLENRRAEVQHRFRIYQEQLYTEDGQGIILSQDQAQGKRWLELSADRHPAQRFQRIQIGEHTLTKRFQPDLSDAIKIPQGNNHLSAKSFDSVIATRLM